jgi:DNA-binding response OmpR family regulator
MSIRASFRTVPQMLPVPTGTILLVQDENALRVLVHRLLRDAGYKVLTARSGPEALLLAEQAGTHIDLLLTDTGLPGMSGSELAAALARRQAGGVRALFMAGELDECPARHGPNVSHAQLLPRPFTPAVLLARVRQGIAGHGAAGAAHCGPTP